MKKATRKQRSYIKDLYEARGVKVKRRSLKKLTRIDASSEIARLRGGG